MVFAPLTRRNGLHAIGATVVDCMLGFCELALYVHLSLRPDVGAVLPAPSTWGRRLRSHYRLPRDDPL